MLQRFFFLVIIAFVLAGCSENNSSPYALPPPQIIEEPVFDDSNVSEDPVFDDSNVSEEPVFEDSNVSEEPVFDDSNVSEEPKASISLEPYYSQQWTLHRDRAFYVQNGIVADAHIHADGLLETYRGDGVKIAIIDDGLDTYHEDLNGAIVATYDLATGGEDVSHNDSLSYHGTAVAGIVGARVNAKGVAGVASEAQIIFLKFKPLMRDSEVIELYERAALLGADVISNSWGTGNVSPAVKAKLIDLANNGRDGKGICIVFAVGNSDADIEGDESSIAEMISVGATNKYNKRADYSNYGSGLDVVAPGGEYLGITTLDVSGSDGGASINEDYLLYNDSNRFVGTSASAPIVSGVIALMLEKNPNLTRVEIENVLKNSADKIGTLLYDLNGRNDYYGHGKVNLGSAMNRI